MITTVYGQRRHGIRQQRHNGAIGPVSAERKCQGDGSATKVQQQGVLSGEEAAIVV